ncbi:Gfo/Idh/MocA family oxidoreductase [Gordonia sp. Z-3]|uniref:Gfo/Idh/MocA family protein n=1 Tax=Gordonia sp. Z-3 TaxID=3115408 RepID=UPI002E282A95|nr:Gfo/Idh/MocA family oxidoreductase [Gordonia sp. Z-3]MED5803920.1 Gfo/Idh/MocA family oxidoreductase [Gordonia sp. Z-3]
MIRIATVGTSTITRNFLDAAASVDEVAVTTVYSRDPRRAAKFAADTGVTHWTDDLDGLLADAEIDAVYLASPNGAHAEQARRVVDAGKHVLVEKPAVPTVAEFDTLLEAAAARKVVVLEAMRNVHDPALRHVAALMATVGPVRRASLSYCQRSARYDKVLAGEHVNIFDPALAGGALLDLGVYTIAAMVEFFGEPNRVTGSSVPIASGVDGAGAVLAAYDDFVVDLSYSKITASDRPDEIQGEHGTLTFDHVAQPTDAQVRMHDGTVTDHTFGGPSNNMVHEIRRFADLVDGDADPASDQRCTRATLRVVEEIQRHQI